MTALNLSGTPVVPCLAVPTDVTVLVTYYQRVHVQGCLLEEYDDYDTLQTCGCPEGYGVRVCQSEYIPIEGYVETAQRIEDELLDRIPVEALGTATVRYVTRSGKELYFRPASQI